ncbi:MAG TPA: DUF4442 domain-containing protein, partial [Rhizobiales bacterium]|nr:DUF4442 domain-containing protein [Hyphomicrobiales bacterium]
MTDKTKPVFAYKDDGLEQRLRKNFLKQGFLIHAGATMGQISPGTVELTLPFSSKVDQHHGFFHGGAIATIADGAAGAAAQTLIARDES